MRAHSARFFLCSALLWFAAAPWQHAAAKAFEGEWATWFCPQGASPGADKCARFALALFQNGEALCGSYASATAGGASQYAGSAPVILGNVTHLTANTLVTVGRAQQRMRVAMNVYNSRLRVQRIDAPPVDVLFPAYAQLKRVNRGAALDPSFVARVEAACAAQFEAPQGVR